MAQTFEVTRSREIAADQRTVFSFVNDLHRWQRWSPWEDLDPDQRRTYSTPANGTGARYAWEGNAKAGKGRMEITYSDLDRVSLDLHFDKPFRGDHTATFTLHPTEIGTLVEWTMRGRKNLVMRLLSPVMDMEQRLGRDFEKGLARLAAVCERTR
ncbi:SRPBCC family protein [Kytococcus sp. Marseille-QA3725]